MQKLIDKLKSQESILNIKKDIVNATPVDIQNISVVDIGAGFAVTVNIDSVDYKDTLEKIFKFKRFKLYFDYARHVRVIDENFTDDMTVIQDDFLYFVSAHGGSQLEEAIFYAEIAGIRCRVVIRPQHFSFAITTKPLEKDENGKKKKLTKDDFLITNKYDLQFTTREVYCYLPYSHQVIFVYFSEDFECQNTKLELTLNSAVKSLSRPLI